MDAFVLEWAVSAVVNKKSFVNQETVVEGAREWSESSAVKEEGFG
jgi:hypothetical protein